MTHYNETLLAKTGSYTNWAIRGLFLALFCLFDTADIKRSIINLPVAGFKPQTFRIGSDRSTNLATTTATKLVLKHLLFHSKFQLSFLKPFYSISKLHNLLPYR